MFGIKINKWGMALIGLILANIAYYVTSNWGLVTVKVNDMPLGKVISSIEWQGWVKIYTNLPLDSKVTMYVDHVPLAEAMESLAANVDVPPPADGDDNGRPNRNADRPGGLANSQPPANGGTGAPPPSGPGASGSAGGFGGRRGGGGFGRAQWNLAFFVAPTSSDVKQEIREFQSSDPGTDNKVFTYGTQIQMIANDNVASTPDPRLQSWAGMKPVDNSATPVATDASANSTAPGLAGTAPADPPAPPPPAVQNYLQAFAQSANIWIMVPGSWAPAVAKDPPPNSSIISAVKNFVGGLRGTTVQAFVLRNGRGGAAGGRPDFAGNDDAWADRMRNAINGLPPDERPEALDQLNQEVDFRKSVRALPPDQRRQKMMQHGLERMIYGERLSRLSPAKRAQIYQRMIALRTAAKAQK